MHEAVTVGCKGIQWLGDQKRLVFLNRADAENDDLLRVVTGIFVKAATIVDEQIDIGLQRRNLYIAKL